MVLFSVVYHLLCCAVRAVGGCVGGRGVPCGGKHHHYYYLVGLVLIVRRMSGESDLL